MQTEFGLLTITSFGVGLSPTILTYRLFQKVYADITGEFAAVRVPLK